MNKYLVRINKSRGQEGRGTTDHVWRIFENDKEYLFKNVVINSTLIDQQTGADYSVYCHGTMNIDKDTSTCTINGEVTKPVGEHKYQIRFNKDRGQEGRGSIDHVWRVFEDGNEFLFKHLKVNVPSYGEISDNDTRYNDNFNVACLGKMTIDKQTSTAVIN